MAAFAYDTVAGIVSDAAVEMGLASAAIADPYASSDQNILQLVALLKPAGREILRHRYWTQLVKEYTFPTTGVASYALPSDFREFIPETMWNRSATFPASGPLNSQEWQQLQAVASGTFVSGRFWQGLLWILPVATTGVTIAYEYMSTSWVAVSGSVIPTKEAPTLKDDVVLFDPHLVTRKLKRMWREAKGFDTSAERIAEDEALRAAAGADAQARTIYLGGQRSQFKRLSADNSPPTIG